MNLNPGGSPVLEVKGLRHEAAVERCSTSAMWPAEKFFWALFEAPGVPVDSPRPPGADGLDLRFADDVPADFEQLHAVYTRVDSVRVVGCAARREDLSAIHSELLELRPASLPAFLHETGCDPASLNLLVGAFEPAALRKVRGARTRWTASAIVMVGLSLSTGLLRRAANADHIARTADEATRAAMAAAMPQEPPGSPTLSLRFNDELNLLRKVHHPNTVAPRDAAASLSDLLAAWPRTAPARTESISVTPSTMSFGAALEDDPKAFIEGLGTPTGWKRDEPRISKDGTLARAFVQFRKEGTP